MKFLRTCCFARRGDFILMVSSNFFPGILIACRPVLMCTTVPWLNPQLRDSVLFSHLLIS